MCFYVSREKKCLMVKPCDVVCFLSGVYALVLSHFFVVVSLSFSTPLFRFLPHVNRLLNLDLSPNWFLLCTKDPSAMSPEQTGFKVKGHALLYCRSVKGVNKPGSFRLPPDGYSLNTPQKRGD